MSPKANYSCPDCNGELEGEDGEFTCRKCGKVVVEYTDSERAILEEEAERDDAIGQLVSAYLEGRDE